ncbi:MAG TPA: phenylalanine--tRNA ligase beta subunit-related protein [Polyangiaceae bacterium]|jgi:DNA/RNA-binding domain of Phe-tRNA-synthetase-like protein|nr:phenylalanine--tRNA ligase beta subunit-related protein [Polyangiaceae bacterium]
MLTIADHPLLELGAFETRFSGPLESPPWLVDLLRADAEAPTQRSEAVRQAVRDLLRHGGYKPTGRGKPASEYLVNATLSSINLAVDACNAVSLHSGLPISVVDCDKLEPPLSVSISQEDESYVFNATGQEIRLRGLLCLRDARGACANAVKDSQRTKTSATTRRTLSLVWGTRAHADHLRATVHFYREILERAGAATSSSA